MGHSQAEKAKNRERILDEAAARIRAHGLEAISVAGLMQAVDLTHGGFYNHFGSRAELLHEALRRALEGGAGKAKTGAPGEDAPGASFRSFLRGYLTRSHRDHPESGCAIAALVSDVGRADPALREPMDRQIEALIARAAEALGDDHAAMLVVSAMVGALALSRVCTDPDRSDVLLSTVRDQLTALLPGGGET